jgi:two-component SAPR family response regulator
MLAAAPGAVDLIVADVRMPEMNGLDLAAEVRRLWPEMPIGLMSGHLPEELESTHHGLAGLPFLRKPFGAAGLIELVDALAAGARHAPADIAFAGGP